MTLPQATIGIIGGSGLYQMDALEDRQEVTCDTPFGPPSDAFIHGTVGGTPVVFLARHGRSHHLLPSEVPYRANIYAMKLLGVEYVISVSAVGSLQEYAKPLDLVIPDQFIDRTKDRPSTFFGSGIVAHVAFAEPFCPALSQLLHRAAVGVDLGASHIHRGGTYLCMEGPAFSTRAESFLYRSWGAKVIGMTNLPEAKLAREAEIAYATLALVTDFDCWHDHHDSVTVDLVIQNLRQNAQNAQKVILGAIALIAQDRPTSIAHTALKDAILTQLDRVPADTKTKLAPILRPYLP
ncbi:MAG: S-methyl-5'-thioadenosine phosphorylase [Oscillatoriales cyanobacterium SM2_2_1]|nr:S-methyl-5'-thioadenosine phosphorylase [Oscillatoriales cyanobacterium SM2_2_1]